MENTKVDYPVTPIISNRQYYTFQLHCYIMPTNSDTSNTNVFTKTILYVIDWLKQRMNFNSETCPENLSVLLKYPGIDEYKTFSISTDVNIKIKDSYNIDSIYIESAKNWSLRFKEQDNMSQFKHDDEIFYGRIFTTDICVRLEHQYTSLSVRTTCTEPTHNSQDCKVYRPKFIHSICNDSTLTTRELPIDSNDYDLLVEEPIRIDTNSKSNNLANNLIDNSERQLPILIFTSEQNSSYDISMIAKRLVAFCHLYIVSSNQFNRLMKARLRLEDIEQGDILIYRNKSSYDIIEQDLIDDKTQIYLIDSLTKYMIRKNISYKNSLFYKEAKIELFRDINSTDFASLLSFKETFDNTILEKDEQIQQIKNDLDCIQEEHRKQKRTIEDYDILIEEAHNSNFQDTIVFVNPKLGQLLIEF